MREYIFRGKDKKTNKWLYGNLHISYIGDDEVNYYIVPFTNMFCYPVKPKTISQYTGLDDYSFRHKVYEGDIVQDITDSDQIGIITYSNDEGKYIINFIDCGLTDDIWCIGSCYKVIGNVWDNPDLIRDKRMLMEWKNERV